MCQKECLGNYHRKCEHFVKLYETGNIIDCGSPNCALSSAHRHPQGMRCKCSNVWREYRKIASLIHDRCEACHKAAWATVERESGRLY